MPKESPQETPSDYEVRKCEFHKKFIQLAERYYHVDPVRLANALLFNFTQNPPENLILVSDTREPETNESDARE